MSCLLSSIITKASKFGKENFGGGMPRERLAYEGNHHLLKFDITARICVQIVRAIQPHNLVFTRHHCQTPLKLQINPDKQRDCNAYRRQGLTLTISFHHVAVLAPDFAKTTRVGA